MAIRNAEKGICSQPVAADLWYDCGGMERYRFCDTPAFCSRKDFGVKLKYMDKPMHT